jgi:hypothetical protein
MKGLLTFLANLRDFDRRWIFLLMAILVLIPLLYPLALPLALSPPVKQYFDTIDALEEGDVVLLSADFDPASSPELTPMLSATLEHLCRKNVRIVGDCLWPAGPPLLERGLNEIANQKFGKVYGVDYVNLGFKEGREAVMLSMGNSITETFPVDFRGTPVSELPLMNDIDNLNSVVMLINISAGYPGTKEWVQQTQSRFGLRIVSGCTAVSAPEYYAYLQSGQLQGLLGGMAGAAEYEALVGYSGSATKGMDAQSLAHLLVILAILMGNLSQWAARRLGER